jgi:hypothetical protein
MEKDMKRILALAILVLTATGFAHAASTVPEIDPTSATAALGLLSGGFMILNSFRKSKKK